jgi:hypothetical protein
MLLAEGGQFPEHVLRHSPDKDRSKAAALRAAAWPLLPLFAGGAAARGTAFPCGFDVGGNGERLIGPAECFAGPCDLLGLPSGAPWVLCDPCIVGAPLPIVVRQAISEGLELLRAFSMAAANRLGIMSVDLLNIPARRLEPHGLVHRRGEGGGSVDGDFIVVPEHDQLFQLQMAGEVDRLVADAFLQAAVAGDHIGEMVDQLLAEPRRHHFSPSAMPTAVAIPCPSGPVVVSTPSVWPYSG